MSAIKSLVKDTAVYGLSSMTSRFLNWLLTIVYSRKLLIAEFGQMTKLYAWIALLLVILTYGMETSFFRFANKSEHPQTVYSTSLWSVGISSLVFMVLGLLFVGDITAYLGFQANQSVLISMMIIISAMDAFTAIPLGYLRLKQRPWRFMMVRMSFVLITIALTLGIFYGVPYLQKSFSLFSWYNQRDALYYVFGINVLANVIQLILLTPELGESGRKFDFPLLKEMLHYSWPILLLGLVGAFSNQADKILFPMLFSDPVEGDTQLGIYGACYKLAVIMVLFTQAFRYAYDPFVFAKVKEGGDVAKSAYAQSMRYYVIFTLFIFLGVMSTLDVLKYFIDGAYFAGLPAVPLVMIGQLMFGVYFNLSLWYKLTDRTLWGAILSIVGSVVAVLFIVLYAEEWGFMACAWASVVSNGVIMLASYFLGQKYYPIRYPLKAIAGYSLLTAVLYAIEQVIATYSHLGQFSSIALNLCLLLIFVLIVLKVEVKREDLRPILVKFKLIKK